MSAGEYDELTVDGVDKDGKPLKKGETVDALTYNTTAVGDPWPIQSKDEYAGRWPRKAKTIG